MSSDYEAIQRAGREFANDFFGRLNATGRAKSVADMFAERARFYAMDVPESSPAVGRAGAVQALRRFCRAYGGGCDGQERRRVVVVSVDARKDDDDDGGGLCCECGGIEGASRPCDRYELFVHAKWTSVADAGARRPLAPPTPFIQTFRVRRPRALAEHGQAASSADHRPHPFEVLNTCVKTTPAAADTPPCTHGFIHSQDVRNKICTTPRIPSSDETILNFKKQLNLKDKEFKSFTSDNDVNSTTTTFVPTRPATTSIWPSYGRQKPSSTRWKFDAGNKSRRRFLQQKEYAVYLKRVETFLNGNNDENTTRAARLCVDGLDASFTANDLYDAFGRFGTVLWVRIVLTDDDHERVQTAIANHRLPRGPVRCVGHVCFEQVESLTRAMNEQDRAHGCIIKGVRLPVRRFVELDQ